MDIFYLLARAALAVAAIVLLTRLNGLRTFSKMSGFDFAVTVALGSVLASAVMATAASSFWINVGALAALVAVQAAISRVRERVPAFKSAIDNAPLLLMENGRILEENLVKGQITRGDLMGKLREANALKLSEVRAVVLEDTGDVSVLHGPGEVDAALLDGVRR